MKTENGYVSPKAPEKAMRQLAQVLITEHGSQQGLPPLVRAALRELEGACQALHAGRLRLVLDCSTSHVELGESIMLNDGTCPLRMENHEHGWFIFLPEELSGPEEQGWEDFPALRAVCAYALELGCGFVNFDVDGEEHPELKEYDW